MIKEKVATPPAEFFGWCNCSHTSHGLRPAPCTCPKDEDGRRIAVALGCQKHGNAKHPLGVTVHGVEYVQTSGGRVALCAACRQAGHGSGGV